MATTFTWIGTYGTFELANTTTYWSPAGPPKAGDTAIINAGGSLLLGSAQLSSNPVYLDGTTGPSGAVDLRFAGDQSITADQGTINGNNSGPTIDQTSVLTTAAAPGASTTTPYVGIIDALGNFINEGTIVAAGASGSAITINVGDATIAGTYYPGFAFNKGVIQADAGDNLTINIGSNAELFNTGQIIANGGSVLIAVSTAAIAGGLAPTTGLIEIMGGGTVETQATYQTGVTGAPPIYGFADTTTGNTLKIDDLGRFGGRIWGFQAGDTIDLGGPATVQTVSYNQALGVAELTAVVNGVTKTADLRLATGGFQSGTFAVSNTGTAGSFIVGTASTGDVLLTTSVVIPTTVTSGVWSSGSIWSTGAVPGANDTPIIMAQGTGTVVSVTTGAGPVVVGGINLADPGATLQATSNTTVSGLVDNLAGTLEVTAGNTLSAEVLSQVTGGATTTIDANGTVLISGAAPLALANNNGTLGFLGGSSLAATRGVAVDGGTLAIDGALLAGPGTSTTGGSIVDGVDASGSTTIVAQGGAIVTDTYALLGSDPTGFGVLTLSGSGTRWTDQIAPTDPLSSRGYMVVGFNDQVSNTPTGMTPPGPLGPAVLTVENFATLTEQTGAVIGDTVDSQGTVLVASGGFWNMASAGVGHLGVGNQGTGILDIAAGGTVAVGGNEQILTNGTTQTFGGIGLGQVSGASGTILVGGSGALLTDSGGLAIGKGGQALLDIESGGTVQVTGGFVKIGTNSNGATGTLIVKGAGALLETTGTVGIAAGDISQGAGSILVGGGGVINDAGKFVIGAVSGAEGVVGVTDGTIIANTLIVGAGSAVGLLGIGNIFAKPGTFNGSVEAASGIIGASGTVGLAGGTLDVTGTLTASGTIGGYGRVIGQLDLLGIAAAVNGNLELSNLSGNTEIESGATLTIDDASTATGSVNFTTGAPEVLSLLSGLGSTNSFAISNWQIGDSIEFGGGTTITSAAFSGTTLDVVTTGGTIAFNSVFLAPGTSTTSFVTGTDAITGQAFVQLSCFATGTRILTMRGPVPVEALAEGDLVVTPRDGGSAPVVWIGHRAVACERHPNPAAVWPVRVAANAFGPGQPERPLFLSPDHAVFIDDMLIPVKYLINGDTIVQAPCQSVTYYHVELPRHAVILAENMPVESYLDVGDRPSFANGGETVRLFPAFGPPDGDYGLLLEAAACAPVVVTGARLQGARARLAQGAERMAVAGE